MEEHLALCLATLTLQKKSCQVPTGQDVGWPPQSWPGCSKQKNILVSGGSQTRSLGHPSHNLATILSYYGSLLLLNFTNVWAANHMLVSLSLSSTLACQFCHIHCTLIKSQRRSSKSHTLHMKRITN